MNDPIFRPTPHVAYAIAWRIVAELMRRHGRQFDIGVYQYFPGLSPWGVLTLHATPLRHEGPALHLNIGGGSAGVIGKIVPFGAVRARRSDWPGGNWAAATLASEDPVGVVDEIEAMSGFPVAKGVGVSTPPVLTARVLAALLQRHMCERDPLRAMPAVLDNQGYVGTTGWTNDVPEIAARIRSAPEAERLAIVAGCWLVHSCSIEGHASHPNYEAGAALALDFTSGRAYQVGRDRPRVVDLCAEYARNNRELLPVIHRCEMLLFSR
jgi:hypothetical protein